MSAIDSKYNVVLDDNVPLPSVICTLSRTLNAEVEEDSIIPRKKKGDDNEREYPDNYVVQGSNVNEIV